MKYLILPFLSIAIQGSALADAEITAGDKLIGVLDQSMQAKEINEPAKSAARQKYVNMFITGSTNHEELNFERHFIKDNNFDHAIKQDINAVKPTIEVVTESANTSTYLENKQVVASFHLGMKETDIKESFAFDTITLDSAYFSTNKTDNHSFELFTVEGQRAYNRLFEVIDRHYIKHTNALTRFGYLLGSSFIVSTSIDAIPTAYHEWGHFSRDRALGGTTSFIHSGTGISYTTGDTNFFNYLLNSQKAIGQDASVNYSDSNMYVGNSAGGKALTSLAFGAGLNNESALAEHVDQEFFFDERPTTFISLWQLKSRTGIALYPKTDGDVNLAVTDYNAYAVTSSLTASKVKTANVYSLLSGSNISSLMAVYNYTTDGATSYKPLMWGDLLIPNQANYFSTRGITRKIQSGYAYSPQTKFVFGLEYVELGQSFKEYNFGVNHKWNKWQGYAKLTVSEKGYLNTELNVSKKLTHNLRVAAYIAQWDSRSLLGERNSLKLSANTTNQGGLRISYLY